MIEVRTIREDEIEKADAIMRASFPSSYYSIFYLYPDSTLVAVEDGAILGGINLDIYEATVRVGYIGWLYVAEEARGRGISRMLADKAIEFLEDNVHADEILLCIEGDNPSSFKNFSSREGFSIMSLHEEISVFRWNIFRVYRHSSRFFDMGYFMWHKSMHSVKSSRSLYAGRGKQIASFICTVLINTLLYVLMALKFNRISALMLLTPAIALSSRIATEALSMRLMGTEPLFLPWDSSWISSLLSLALPFYFPSPGGIYPRGDSWSLGKKERVLGMSAISGVIAEAAMLLVMHGRYEYLAFGIPLFLLDTVFPMYPFCGFLASRIRRTAGRLYPIAIILSVVISVLSILF